MNWKIFLKKMSRIKNRRKGMKVQKKEYKAKKMHVIGIPKGEEK